MKSKSHSSMKLAPVRVFSCKHPLTVASGTKESCYRPHLPHPKEGGASQLSGYSPTVYGGTKNTRLKKVKVEPGADNLP